MPTAPTKNYFFFIYNKLIVTLCSCVFNVLSFLTPRSSPRTTSTGPGRMGGVRKRAHRLIVRRKTINKNVIKIARSDTFRTKKQNNILKSKRIRARLVRRLIWGGV